MTPLSASPLPSPSPSPDLKRYYLSTDADVLALLQKKAKYLNPVQFKQLQKRPASISGYFVVVTKDGGNYFVNAADKKVYAIQDFSAAQALTALVNSVGIRIEDQELRKIGLGRVE